MAEDNGNKFLGFLKEYWQIIVTFVVLISGLATTRQHMIDMSERIQTLEIKAEKNANAESLARLEAQVSVHATSIARMETALDSVEKTMDKLDSKVGEIHVFLLNRRNRTNE